MRIKRIDHLGINVDDLPAATAFFRDLGLEVVWEGEMAGELLERVVALDGARTSVVMLRTPDGGANIELIKYHAPTDEQGVQPQFPNTHGIRHFALVVEDIDALVAKLGARGTELFSPIQQFEESYKLCYIHGPEGIIIELAEELG